MTLFLLCVPLELTQLQTLKTKTNPRILDDSINVLLNSFYVHKH